VFRSYRMDRLYTLVIIILIGFFVHWYQQKQIEINNLKYTKKKHATKNKKKSNHKKKSEKRNNIQKKINNDLNKKKVKFAENIIRKSSDNNDHISIDSLESSDYNSLIPNLKNDDNSSDDFLDD